LCVRCWMTWPRMPLDVSQSDPATQDAFNTALFAHCLSYAWWAVVPPLVLLLLARALLGGSR
jgi:hypothetical protein